MEGSDQNGGVGSPNLAPDQATIQGAVDRSDAVALSGWLADDPSPDHCRLFENLTFDRYLRIRRADILDRAAENGDLDPTSGRTVVFLQPDAVVESLGRAPASSFNGPTPGGDVQYKYPRP